jgi:thioredoxin
MAIVTCPNCGTKNRFDERRAQVEQPVCGRCHAKLNPGVPHANEPIALSDSVFRQFVASAGDKPVLVDCWAAWCGPCRMLAPTIDQLAREAEGRWYVTKLDTDANPQTSMQFRISSIPTMLIFRNGNLVDQLVGLHPKQAIEARLAAHSGAT